MPSSHLILCRPLLRLPSVFPSIRVFSNELALCIRWPKDWSFSFSFSISPSDNYSGLISFRMGQLDLLAVQGTLKSLPKHHSSKASFLWHSAFSIVQLSHPYMTTGKTKALTRWTFVGKVMSLLFNMLFRWVMTFLPRSNHLLISWTKYKVTFLEAEEDRLKGPGSFRTAGGDLGALSHPCCHTIVFFLVHSCRVARLWTRPSDLKYFLGVTVFVWTQGFERCLTFFIIWRVQGVLNPRDNNKGPPFTQFVYRLITVWCCRALQL